MTARQLPLSLDHPPAFGRENFLVAPCNAEAVALIDRWPDWPQSLLVLCGPAGAGKSHLAEAWRVRSKARVLTPAQFAAALDDIQSGGLLEAPALLIDGINGDSPVGAPASREAALCRLIDGARAQGVFVVLTARRAPSHWATSLTDLRTRLAGLPLATLGPPDEILLTNLAVKLFADRRLAAPPAAVMRMIARLERSFATVAAAVEAIDRASLAQRRAVTPQLVDEIVNDLNPDLT